MQDIVKRLEAMTPEQRRALKTVLDERGATVNVHPLSSAQQRMWFLTVVHGNTPTYTVPYAFWLTGSVDPAALGRALLALVQRHDVLRTVFFDIDGEPYQTVQPATTFALRVRHWRPQDAAREDLVARVLDAEARRVFDLRQGPPIAATLLTSGAAADRHLFLLTMHHMVCDGWSMGILFRELEECYRAAQEGREPALPALPIRYVDYARWQAAGAVNGRAAAHLRYWEEVLADPPEPPAFIGRPARPAALDVAGGLEVVVWPRSVARAVEEFSGHAGVTPFMTVLAVFAEILRRRTGAEDIVFGTPVANRNRLELENVVGFFVNTLPLRVRPTGRAGLREALRHVREVALGAQAHQDAPFEQVVEQLGADRNGSHNPLFQVSFVMQDKETELLRLPGMDASIVHGHSGTAKFDMTAAFSLLEDGLKAALEYRRAMFDRPYVCQLLDETVRLLLAAMAEPERPLGTLACEVAG